MGRVSIGNTNVSLGNQVLYYSGAAPFPPNAKQMSWAAQAIFPTQSGDFLMSVYAVAASQYIYILPIKVYTTGVGYVALTYPYDGSIFNNSSSPTSIVTSIYAVHSYYYSYITIRAYPTYPYTFQYWRDQSNNIYSYTNILNVYYYDSAITSDLTLSAVII